MSGLLFCVYSCKSWCAFDRPMRIKLLLLWNIRMKTVHKRLRSLRRSVKSVKRGETEITKREKVFAKQQREILRQLQLQPVRGIEKIVIKATGHSVPGLILHHSHVILLYCVASIYRVCSGIFKPGLHAKRGEGYWSHRHYEADSCTGIVMCMNGVL